MGSTKQWIICITRKFGFCSVFGALLIQANRVVGMYRQNVIPLVVMISE